MAFPCLLYFDPGVCRRKAQFLPYLKVRYNGQPKHGHSSSQLSRSHS